MSANATTAAPTGRNKPAQGKEHGGRPQGPTTALGHASPNTSSPEGAKEGGELPCGWIRLTMGEVGRWFGGGTPSKANPRFWTGGNIPWVSPKDMKFDLITDAQDHITEDAVAQSATNLVEPGSILIVVRSGILQHTLPVAVASRQVALNQDLKAVKPLENIRSDYLALALKAFERDILHTCTKTGTTVQSLELPVFLRFQIPVAPVPEQRRIVAEIEKQFTRLEAGVAALRRVKANLKRYRAAVLKAACEGRLVPTQAELARQRAASHPGGVLEISRGSSAATTPGLAPSIGIHPGGVAENDAASGTHPGCDPNGDTVPGVFAALDPRLISESPPGFSAPAANAGSASHSSYETGEALLARILTERRQIHERAQADATRKKKYKEPTLPSAPADQELPEGWTWAAWEQIGLSQNGRPFPSAEYNETGFKLLRPGNLNVSGKVVWTDSNTRCMPQKFADENPDLIVRGGELVMNLTAQSLKDEFLGRVCITADDEGCLLNQRLARLTPIIVLPKFVLCLLKAWRFRRYVDGLNSGSLIQHMFTSQLAEFTFPLPPLAEQTRIVAEVERRLSVVEELEAVVSANLQRATRLRQSILQRAFTGKLVTADDADNTDKK